MAAKQELERSEERIMKYRKSEWKERVKARLGRSGSGEKKKMEELKSYVKKLRFTNTN